MTFHEYISEMTSNITKIAVFDFDGTLIYTPERPKTEGGKKFKGPWWGSSISLKPPYMPEELEDKHLNPKVAAEYKKAVASPDTFTVMMTGRHSGLKNHVLDILKKAYDIEPHNNPGRERAIFVDGNGSNTLQVKVGHLLDLLKEFPNVVRIDMWEDRPAHAQMFVDVGKEIGKTIIVHQPPDWL
jgi:hypothetical protein